MNRQNSGKNQKQESLNLLGTKRNNFSSLRTKMLAKKCIFEKEWYRLQRFLIAHFLFSQKRPKYFSAPTKLSFFSDIKYFVTNQNLNQVEFTYIDGIVTLHYAPLKQPAKYSDLIETYIFWDCHPSVISYCL